MTYVAVRSNQGFHREEIFGTAYVKLGNKKRFIGLRAHDCLVFRNRRHFKQATAFPRSCWQNFVSYAELNGAVLTGQLGVISGISIYKGTVG